MTRPDAGGSGTVGPTATPVPTADPPRSGRTGWSDSRATPHDHGGPEWWDDLSVRPAHAESEAWPAVGVVVALTASNVMTNRVLPRWAYVPWNVAVASGLVWWARAAGGCSGAELGLSRRHLLGGLRWGLGAAGAVGALYATGAAVPRTRAVFRDDRADQVGPAELAWRVLVEIPFGTALTEEVAFRGVLPALFRRRFAGEPNWAARAGLPILPLADASQASWEEHLAGTGWIVDAMLGTGCTSAARGSIATAIEAINAVRSRESAQVFAVDLPSGLDCDTGLPLGPCVRADITGTFVARKRGFDRPESAAFTGRVHVLDIGVPRRLLADSAGVGKPEA